MINTLSYLLILTAFCVIGCDRHEDRRFTPQIEGSCFIGTDNAWLTIKSGELLRTEDGGSTWKRSKEGADGFTQVNFIDSKHGWAINIRGDVSRSFNGGQTWTGIGKVQVGGGVFGKAQQMHFLDERNGWIVDSFSVWVTENGGASWIRSFPLQRTNGEIGTPSRYFQLNEHLGWIAATNGEVYRTQDGKRSWQRLLVSKRTDLTDIFFIDENTGWMSGEPDGGIYKTNDGGSSWAILLKQTGTNNIGIQSLYFFDEREGWAVGRRYPQDVTVEPTEGVVLHTIDGGSGWQKIRINHGELFYSQIKFVDRQNGWLIGQENVYRTSDGGRTWNMILKVSSMATQNELRIGSEE